MLGDIGDIGGDSSRADLEAARSSVGCSDGVSLLLVSSDGVSSPRISSPSEESSSVSCSYCESY